MKYLIVVTIFSLTSFYSCSFSDKKIERKNTDTLSYSKEKKDSVSTIILKKKDTLRGKTIESFIPKGYEILASASGDFNGDGYMDVVIILNKDSVYLRPMFLLMGDSEKQYNLVARNDSVALCEGCAGLCCEPNNTITTKKEYFSIENYGGDNNFRWTRITTFKFDKESQQFILHKDILINEDAYGKAPVKAKDKYEALNKENFDKLPFTSYSNSNSN